MSGHNCTSVDVVVRHRGGTNIARAGIGRDAETASSTNNGLFAAEAAARKYFGPRATIRLTLKQNGGFCSGNTIYTARIWRDS